MKKKKNPFLNLHASILCGNACFCQLKSKMKIWVAHLSTDPFPPPPPLLSLSQIIEDHRTNLAYIHMALRESHKKPEASAGDDTKDFSQPTDSDIAHLSSLLAKALTSPSIIEHIATELQEKSPAQSSDRNQWRKITKNCEKHWEKHPHSSMNHPTAPVCKGSACEKNYWEITSPTHSVKIVLSWICCIFTVGFIFTDQELTLVSA